MKNIVRKLSRFLQKLFRQLTQLLRCKSKRKVVHKTNNNFELEPFSSNEQVTQQPASQIKKTDLRPTNYPPLPTRRLRIDRPFEVEPRENSLALPFQSKEPDPTPLNDPPKSQQKPPIDGSFEAEQKKDSIDSLVSQSKEISNDKKAISNQDKEPNPTPINYPQMPRRDLLIDRPFEVEPRENSIDYSVSQLKEISNDKTISKSKIGKSHTAKQRPYINYLIDDLEKLAKLSWNNQVILCTILEELSFRSSPRSKALFIEISQRLDLLQNTKFVWPNTTITNNNSSAFNNNIEVEKGLLRILGYKVGLRGLSQSDRRQILDDIFQQSLPQMNDISSQYLRKWGEPNSAQRLKKLAQSIAKFTRLAKGRKDGNHSQSIADWESDLAYLKQAYYDRSFYFKWPRTKD